MVRRTYADLMVLDTEIVYESTPEKFRYRIRQCIMEVTLHLAFEKA
jgi:hypothetical protein